MRQSERGGQDILRIKLELFFFLIFGLFLNPNLWIQNLQNGLGILFIFIVFKSKPNSNNKGKFQFRKMIVYLNLTLVHMFV